MGIVRQKQTLSQTLSRLCPKSTAPEDGRSPKPGGSWLGSPLFQKDLLTAHEPRHARELFGVRRQSAAATALWREPRLPVSKPKRGRAALAPALHRVVGCCRAHGRSPWPFEPCAGTISRSFAQRELSRLRRNPMRQRQGAHGHRVLTQRGQHDLRSWPERFHHELRQRLSHRRAQRLADQ